MRTKPNLLSSRSKYFSAALSAATIWGFFSIPLRALKAYPSEQILHFRILISLLFTWLIILLFRRKQLLSDWDFIKATHPEKRKAIFILAFFSGILITGNWYSFIYAINHVSIKSAAFAYMVCPLITALGGFVILKEAATRYKVAGISLAIFSIVILASGSAHEVLWSIFIASLYAFYLLIQRMIPEIDKLNMLGIQLIIATIIMLPLFLYHQYSLPLEAGFWLNIILIALVFTVLPLFLSLYALIGIDSSTMGVLIYINPIVAFTVAFLYFTEYVTLIQALAYSMLFIAVLIFNGDFIKRYFKNSLS